MPWIALGASVVGGIGNYLANSSAQDRAQMLQDKSLQQWMQVNIPDPEQQKLVLQKFVQTGTLDPKLEKAIQADPSAFKNIITNQQDRAAQSRALSELSNIGTQGGLRLQDRAALQDSLMAQQVKDRADRQGIASQMAQRGLGGSGFDIAAQLQGQQGTSDQAAKNSLSVAASAQDRALQSLMQAGNLATQYRTQDFGEQQAKAAAADKINMFNTQNLQDVQNRNIAAQNAAMANNLANQQDIANKNTSLGNQQQQYNSQLLQQQFENQAKKAGGVSGQYQNQANLAQQQGQTLGNVFSNLGQAGAGIGTSMGQKSAFDDYFNNLKKKQQGGF